MTHMTSTPIRLERLICDPLQPRTAIPEPELAALAESIRARGLLLPLRVKPADASGHHVIISGHRRHAALLQLGIEMATCIIVDGSSDEAAILAEQLAENLLREDLNAIDEAEGYRRYITLRGCTAAKAASELQVTAARISRALALLTLSDEVRELVRSGQLPKETAYHLSRLPEGEERQRLFALAVAGQVSRDTAARAAKAKRPDDGDVAPVTRVTCKLSASRSLTVCAETIRIDSLIETLEEVLKEARKARQQGWDVTTLAKVFRDRAAVGGAA